MIGLTREVVSEDQATTMKGETTFPKLQKTRKSRNQSEVKQELIDEPMPSCSRANEDTEPQIKMEEVFSETYQDTCTEIQASCSQLCDFTVGMDKMSTMDWSNELILEFIQLYESHPVLWNPRHEKHKNRNSLHDAWQNIAHEISTDVTVDALRRKKESLMATYRTLAKKVRSSQTTGSGAKDVYAPTWFAFDAIDRFIKAKSNRVPSLSSEETHIEEFSEDEISQKEEQIVNDEANVKQYNSEPLVCETSQDRVSMQSRSEKRVTTNFILPQGAPKIRRRVGPTQVESNVTKHLKLASDALIGLANKSQTRQTDTLQDELTLYGQLLAAKLRGLPKRTQLILQNKIDNLVFEEELKEIDYTPSVINSNNYCSSVFTLSPTNSQVSSTPTCVLSPASPEIAKESV